MQWMETVTTSSIVSFPGLARLTASDTHRKPAWKKHSLFTSGPGNRDIISLAHVQCNTSHQLIYARFVQSGRSSGVRSTATKLAHANQRQFQSNSKDRYFVSLARTIDL